MLFIYNIGIHLFYLTAALFSLYKNKAKLWINGRKHQQIKSLESSIWFHFASLGEFEQGRPVLEAVKKQYPLHNIVVTFFSPSGYEPRKNTPLADVVYYLPLDTAANAQHFISTIRPQMAVFTKYEYWHHFFNELHKQHIPLYIISGIFRPGQVFFKWYGGLHRKMLKMVTWFFLQDAQSKQLLHDIGITNVSISGDTRFDRVWANAGNPKNLPEIAQFKNGQKLFIAGSTWPQDEELIAEFIKQHPDWKFIIAPHETSEEKIKSLTNLLPTETTIKFSEISNLKSNISNLVIDNIGMLSSLYQYADIAYIGGGFGEGIHNTLEAAAFGMPVIFGPKYHKFKEARDLVELGAGFTINSQDELNQIADKLMGDEQARHAAVVIAKDYVQQNIGATETIVNYIKAQH
ncbi:3-deoxy-D-manno-octulosonic acid transferase [Mucilaginibacter achroorhodeus]|uniref:3-deoxy-D-manno-octulosonic acid transferase n=1 Tax=Mucilaginibacter achroorhodeus TaxID=2599294 RepID=A0A563U1T7_9SPHI|nr:glycosyltransferase N-terminal domain-containing protein [Mucilaginibacter achroorhodeus]TWR25052.1 3-deoxy-D-manno-octulosonic acid transferase [Mucilaginibacter achroorhodeus]